MVSAFSTSSCLTTGMTSMDMKSSVLLSLKLHIPQVMILKSNTRKSRVSIVTCGLRGETRKSMWRSRLLSTEAIQAIHALKLAKSDSKLEQVFHNKLSRLLKADLLDSLTELRRQNELHLALKVFEFVRKEVWYKPDVSLYSDMILMFGKNKMIKMAEEFFTTMEKEGLKPDTRAFNEMIGAYLQVGSVEKAIEKYETMKESGCVPDKLTFTILIRNLEKVGKEDLATILKKECAEYMEYPEKFLEALEQTHPKKRFLDLV